MLVFPSFCMNVEEEEAILHDHDKPGPAALPCTSPEIIVEELPERMHEQPTG